MYLQYILTNKAIVVQVSVESLRTSSLLLLPPFSSILFFSLLLSPVSQGFLSDLLKKAKRDYDEKKLKEYTQTIVSS